MCGAFIRHLFRLPQTCFVNRERRSDGFTHGRGDVAMCREVLVVDHINKYTYVGTWTTNTLFYCCYWQQMVEGKVVRICSAYAMRRSDKQPDRVEISPEQLSAAAIEAEVICLWSGCMRPLGESVWHIFTLSNLLANWIAQFESWAGTTVILTSLCGPHT